MVVSSQGSGEIDRYGRLATPPLLIDNSDTVHKASQFFRSVNIYIPGSSFSQYKNKLLQSAHGCSTRLRASKSGTRGLVASVGISLFGKPRLTQPANKIFEPAWLFCRQRRLQKSEGTVRLSMQRLLDGLARFRSLAEIAECRSEHRV